MHLSILTVGGRSRVTGLPSISNNVGPVKFVFLFCRLFSFLSTLLRSLQRVALLLPSRLDGHGSFVICAVGFGPTQPSLRSKLRPCLLLQTPFAGSGMPYHMNGVLVHTMDDSE